MGGPVVSVCLAFSNSAGCLARVPPGEGDETLIPAYIPAL